MKTIQRRSMRFLILVGMAIPAASTGLAQEERAIVTGTITDPSNSAVGEASVVIHNAATGFHRGSEN